MTERDYDHCWVCGELMGPDKMHVLIDNGRVMRHVYCCRRHRYVAVDVRTYPPDRPNETVIVQQIQTRTDLGIESLAHAFYDGKLKEGWE